MGGGEEEVRDFDVWLGWRIGGGQEFLVEDAAFGCEIGEGREEGDEGV